MDAHVGLLIDSLERSGRPLSEMVDAVPADRLAAFCPQLVQIRADAADRALDAWYEVVGGQRVVLATAASVAVGLPIERQLVWSARLRAEGLPGPCPLVGATIDRSRPAASGCWPPPSPSVRSPTGAVARRSAPTSSRCRRPTGPAPLPRSAPSRRRSCRSSTSSRRCRRATRRRWRRSAEPGDRGDDPRRWTAGAGRRPPGVEHPDAGGRPAPGPVGAPGDRRPPTTGGPDRGAPVAGRHRRARLDGRRAGGRIAGRRGRRRMVGPRPRPGWPGSAPSTSSTPSSSPRWPRGGGRRPPPPPRRASRRRRRHRRPGRDDRPGRPGVAGSPPGRPMGTGGCRRPSRRPRRCSRSGRPSRSSVRSGVCVVGDFRRATPIERERWEHVTAPALATALGTTPIAVVGDDPGRRMAAALPLALPAGPVADPTPWLRYGPGGRRRGHRGRRTLAVGGRRLWDAGTARARRPRRSHRLARAVAGLVELDELWSRMAPPVTNRAGRRPIDRGRRAGEPRPPTRWPGCRRRGTVVGPTTARPAVARRSAGSATSSPTTAWPMPTGRSSAGWPPTGRRSTSSLARANARRTRSTRSTELGGVTVRSISGLVDEAAVATAVEVRHQWPPDLSPPASGRLVLDAAVGVRRAAGRVDRTGPRRRRRAVGTDDVGPRLRGGQRRAGRPGPRRPVRRRRRPVPARRPTVRAARRRSGRGSSSSAAASSARASTSCSRPTSARSPPTDDVCLVVKPFGSDTVYRTSTLEADVRRAAAGSGAAVEVVDGDLTGAEMADLYRSCDALVHPYRGEGFGLPIAEAMASGTARRRTRRRPVPRLLRRPRRLARAGPPRPDRPGRVDADGRRLLVVGDEPARTGRRPPPRRRRPRRAPAARGGRAGADRGRVHVGTDGRRRRRSLGRPRRGAPGRGIEASRCGKRRCWYDGRTPVGLGGRGGRSADAGSAAGPGRAGPGGGGPARRGAGRRRRRHDVGGPGRADPVDRPGPHRPPTARHRTRRGPRHRGRPGRRAVARARRPAARRYRTAGSTRPSPRSPTIPASASSRRRSQHRRCRRRRARAVAVRAAGHGRPPAGPRLGRRAPGAGR